MGQMRSRGAAVILLIAGSACCGVVGAATNPACQRFVKTQVVVPVRNKVSKATLEAWKKWGIGHPTWKPNPNVHRPKYIMSRQEVMKKVEFACEATPVPGTLDGYFPPITLDGIPPAIGMFPPPSSSMLPPPSGEAPPIELTELTVPGDIPPVPYDTLPPTEITPPEDSNTPYFPPILPPVFGGGPGGGGGGGGGGTGGTGGSGGGTPVTPPPAITPVPEPGSMGTVLTGIAAVLGVWRKRQSNQNCG